MKNAEDHYNQGKKLTESKEYNQATTAYQQAIDLQPNYPAAYYELGNTFCTLEKLDDAINAYQMAIALDPTCHDAYINLGAILQHKNNHVGALTLYQHVLTLNPDLPDAHNNIGNAYLAQGEADKAIAAYQWAIRINPQHAVAYNNLGNALVATNKFDEAIEMLQQAVKLRPDWPEAYHNLGSALQNRRCFDQAIMAYQKCLALNPKLIGPQFNMSLISLALGNYKEGWEKFELRWQISPLDGDAKRYVGLKKWQRGEDIAGKTLLLAHEQGFGDTLQFIRYVPLVAKMGAKIILGCPKELKELLAPIDGVTAIVTDLQDAPAFDLYCPLMSLPYILGTTLESIPATIPYLKADAALQSKWQKKLKRDKNLKVGLVWAGGTRKGLNNNITYYVDCRRSLHLSQLASLYNRENISFYSLQKGGPSAQIKQMAKQFKLIDYTKKIKSFADTAALIANLDLVIAVDTAVAHLAGAMGKPTWILSRFDACWRWLDHREDSPWYPTVRLFHQKEPGNWAEVIQRVATALTDLIKDHPREKHETKFRLW